MRYKVLFTILIFLFPIFSNIHCRTTKNPGNNDSNEMEFRKSLRISENVSKILDQLLKGYDKRLRPNYAGPPVEVGITININNINSVSEVNMDYTMDIFFRQMWTDKRLSFGGVSELVIGSDMLHKIWVPDTYIANDRKTYFHKATVQNKFIRINPDGQVLYSMRMTVTAACPMDFRLFPMDHQECDLEIESYGFRMEDIKYKWAAGLNTSAVDVAPTIELPQLKYKEYKLIERQFRLSTGLYSRLTMKLYFVRSLGYFITQIYIPSTLLVALSWVSFWLDRTAAPARVSLGITTVLTMVTFIWSTNASLPKISYIKGIDVYLVCCFFMTFASVIEYAMVSYIHHRTERRKRKSTQKLQVLQNPNQLQQLAILNHNNLIHNLKQNEINEHINRNRENKCDKNIYHDINEHRKHYLKTHSDHHHHEYIDKEFEPLNDDDDGVNIRIYREKPRKCTCNMSKNRNLDANLSQRTSHKSTKSGRLPRNNHSEHSLNEIKSCSISNKDLSMMQQYQQSELFDRIKNNSIRALSESSLRRSVSTQNSRKKKFCRIKASTIDNYSRIIFPATFLTFHLIYWTYYLKIAG
ncbi:unnamed protein product [Brachionus calyciflorus]|uniref:Gamma-aminobutyric acid receptor subunit beta n=1 Tax=Brachionus calyciflorus TaxID=104777 RepID=A0A813MFY3_9BILA|nr:unnamed protein product [Brachionus calyciflorus]